MSTPVVHSPMLNLVEIIDQKAVTTSQIIAEAFAKQHKNVLRDIEKLECSEEFGRLNFEPSSYLNAQNKSQPMFNITRDGFMWLAMGFTGKRAAEYKEKFIAAFNLMEESLINKQSPDFDDPHVMQQYLNRYASKVIEHQKTIAQLSPKAAALEKITMADGQTCITNAAKTLQMRPKDLFAWLSANKWIYRRVGGKSWVGYQDKIQRGYVIHKVTIVTMSDGTEKITEQALITAKGMACLAEMTAPAIAQ